VSSLATSLFSPNGWLPYYFLRRQNQFTNHGRKGWQKEKVAQPFRLKIPNDDVVDIISLHPDKNMLFLPPSSSCQTRIKSYLHSEVVYEA
jgi:hypothetical protein